MSEYEFHIYATQWNEGKKSLTDIHIYKPFQAFSDETELVTFQFKMICGQYLIVHNFSESSK